MYLTEKDAEQLSRNPIYNEYVENRVIYCHCIECGDLQDQKETIEAAFFTYLDEGYNIEDICLFLATLEVYTECGEYLNLWEYVEELKNEYL